MFNLHQLGHTVYLFAKDFTVFGGSHLRPRRQDRQAPGDGAEEPLPGDRPVRRRRRPHPGGGVAALGGYGEVFQRSVLASGVIPQISMIMGPAPARRRLFARHDRLQLPRFELHVRDRPRGVKTVTHEEVTSEELAARSTVHQERRG